MSHGIGIVPKRALAISFVLLAGLASRIDFLLKWERDTLADVLKRLELKRLAADRLKDAQSLLKAKRYNGAIYLCGYAVELALKARICQTLKWADFPETAGEFDKHGMKLL
jgi:hypothetical protein